jgi:hypothetical protein
MYTWAVILTRLVRRAVRSAAGCLLGGAMMVPLGPTTAGQAVNQMNQMSTRPLPSADARPVVRDDMIWVPDRTIRVPGQGDALVPGHWERLTPEGQRNVPPVTATDPSGTVTQFPSRDYPQPAERPYGP